MVTAALARMGRLDVLVNNAGIADTFLPTLEQGADLFMRQLDIHLKGTFVASREAAKAMLGAGGGAIVNLASDRRLTGLPRRNGYGAAKAGIIALTRSLAAEWGSGGVRVNAIAPGYVRTALVEALERRARSTPRRSPGARRWGGWRGRRRWRRWRGSWPRRRRAT